MAVEAEARSGTWKATDPALEKTVELSRIDRSHSDQRHAGALREREAQAGRLHHAEHGDHATQQKGCNVCSHANPLNKRGGG